MSEQLIPPFISQYATLPPEWGSRGCGLVALKIVLDYWHSVDRRHQTFPLSQLLIGALEDGAYLNGVGWTHGGLAAQGSKLGYKSFNRDLPREHEGMSNSDALDILKKAVLGGPVLVSVWKGFDQAQKGGHIVVVYEISGGYVHLIDPEKESEAEGRTEMSVEQFSKGFKQRFICLSPK